MSLIIKGPQKCSGACVLQEHPLRLLSSRVYGFMRGAWYGTTYHLIGHHNNDRAAIGRGLQISECLGVRKRMDKSVCEKQRWCLCKGWRCGGLFICESKLCVLMYILFVDVYFTVVHR